MKITKQQLKRIIKEELKAVLEKKRKEKERSSEVDPYERALEAPLAEEEKAKRSAKGNITQATREKYATVGKDGFPIFDRESAVAAINLRGHASPADQKKIINKAAKYAPAEAKKAREAEKKEKK